MTDYVAIHTDNALAFIVRNGVPASHARKVLSVVTPASSFGGAKYYYPDDLEAAADCYHDARHA